MHDYELTVIVSPQITEENLPAIIDRVSKLISDRGGVVSEVNKWGRRKLAYPINRFEEGNYFLTRFKLNADKVGEIERNLTISEDLLRHLVIKAE